MGGLQTSDPGVETQKPQLDTVDPEDQDSGHSVDKRLSTPETMGFTVVLTCRVQVRHSVDKRLSTPWRGFHFGTSLVLSARAPVSTQLPCGKRFHSELCTHLFKKEVSIGQDQARGPTKGASHGASHH